jgi:hypothetical protein
MAWNIAEDIRITVVDRKSQFNPRILAGREGWKPFSFGSRAIAFHVSLRNLFE